MTARRRQAGRKYKEYTPPAWERREKPAGQPVPLPDDSSPGTEQRPEINKTAGVDCLPVAAVLKILAEEYGDGERGEALCRAALRIAEEGGVIENYRSRWDAEETDLSSRLSVLLFDRRQCLELIRYYQTKGNREALQREKDKLREIEGRLLLGGASPVRITEEDLEELERYIKECGF